MFERKNFMVYVGEKSGASYVSGLSKIEEIYKVNVDAEFMIKRGQIWSQKSGRREVTGHPI